MAENNAFFFEKFIFLINFFLFFLKIAMYACMHEMRTHLNKERNKHILYLYITHNKQALKRYLHPYIFRTRIQWRVSFPRIVGLVLFINRG